jgi:ribosomal protein L29
MTNSENPEEVFEELAELVHERQELLFARDNAQGELEINAREIARVQSVLAESSGDLVHP